MAASSSRPCGPARQAPTRAGETFGDVPPSTQEVTDMVFAAVDVRSGFGPVVR
jgi:hypothetical protein